MKKLIIIFISLSMIGLFGCSKTPKIELGDKVTLTYAGTLDNGEIIDDGEKTITIGSGEIIKGIDKALLGKEENKRFKLEISPEDGYGNQYSIYNLQRVSPIIFQKLGLPTQSGTITKINDISGIIRGEEVDQQGNKVLIFDINPAKTRQKINYAIFIKKLEKTGTGITL